MTPAPALALAAPKLCPLVRLLGSEIDGEILAAARGLRRILIANGSDLHALADWIAQAGIDRPTPAPEPPPKPKSDPADTPEYWADLAARCQSKGRWTLAQRDLVFLDNVLQSTRAGRIPTPKQQKWFGDILAKLEAKR